MNRHTLILAPSSAGKSYFVAHLCEQYPNVHDGDKIIASTIGWPPGRWWETAVRDLTHIRNQEALADFITRNDAIVLFNGRWEPALTPGIGVLVVIPPLPDLKRNVEAKRAAGIVNQPITLAEIEHNAQSLLDFAEKHRLTVFDSLASAVMVADGDRSRMQRYGGAATLDNTITEFEYSIVFYNKQTDNETEFGLPSISEDSASAAWAKAQRVLNANPHLGYATLIRHTITLDSERNYVGATDSFVARIDR